MKKLRYFNKKNQFKKNYIIYKIKKIKIKQNNKEIQFKKKKSIFKKLIHINYYKILIK